MRSLFLVLIITVFSGCTSVSDDAYRYDIVFDVHLESNKAKFMCSIDDSELSRDLDSAFLMQRCNDAASGYVAASELDFDLEDASHVFNRNGSFRVRFRPDRDYSDVEYSDIKAEDTWGFIKEVSIAPSNNAV